MSEFVKKLERISRGKSQPMGFRPTVEAKTPPMMLVCQLEQAEVEAINLALSAGVDALLFAFKSLKGEIDALAQISSSIGQVPWGVRFEDINMDEVNKLATIGCDYLLFKTEVPARILQEEKMGKVVELETSLDDSLLRSLGQLAIDAIFFNKGEEFPLTIRKLLDYQRVIGLVGKPALAFLPPNLPAGELENLWEAGIRGLITNLSKDSPREELLKIKEAIQRSLPTKRAPKTKIEAVLPAMELPTEEPEEEI